MPDFSHRFRALHAGQRTPISASAPVTKVDGTVAVLRLYDVIDSWGGPWGTSASEMAAVLDELPDTVTEIELHLNSPGGEVTEGVAVLNVLRQHAAKVTAIVDGLAASAASFLAAGCDELVMMPNSELMVHNAWGVCIGDAEDMRALADLLDHMADNIASIYMAKAGGELADWRALMQQETWFSADEAVAAGLADRVADGDPAEADAAKNRFDLSIFNFSGRREAPGPQHPVVDPDAGPNKQPKGGPAVAISDEQLTHLRQRLGLADEADETAILAAIDQTLDEYVEPNKGLTPSALPEGVVAIDQAQLDVLKADAAAGREARAEQIATHRSAVVEAAIQDGRIPPARREAWLAQLEADPGAEQVLASLAAGTVPVTALGSNAGDVSDDDEVLFASLFGKQEVKA